MGAIRRTGLIVGGAALLLGLAGCGGEPAAVPEPPAKGNVLDSADVLTDAQEQDLNALIDDHNGNSNAARVAVLTVENAGGSIEDYAREVATAWGVGDDGADNGVLIVADTGERELRIETADGVRESFSDDEAEDIIEDVLEPAFADERYAEGLNEAADQVYLYAEGGVPAREPFNWVLLVSIVGGAALTVGLLIFSVVQSGRRQRRKIDEEIRAAEDSDPDLNLTEEQREAYRKYRESHRGDDAVTNPAVWLPLYVANPAAYSGGSTGAQSGSSFGGGGGFSGGGASGSY